MFWLSRLLIFGVVALGLAVSLLVLTRQVALNFLFEVPVHLLDMLPLLWGQLRVLPLLLLRATLELPLLWMPSELLRATLELPPLPALPRGGVPAGQLLPLSLECLPLPSAPVRGATYRTLLLLPLVESGALVWPLLLPLWVGADGCRSGE